MTKPVHVYSSFIRASIETVWDALTNPELTVRYFYGTIVDCEWRVGASMTYRYPDGRLASTGEVLAIDPPRRLECTFLPEWGAEKEVVRTAIISQVE